jgi:hypothetical protein
MFMLAMLKNTIFSMFGFVSTARDAILEAVRGLVDTICGYMTAMLE